MTARGDILLDAAGLTKAYGPVTVLNGCALRLRAGEIHALLGGNGAGKSTTAKIIAGLTPATAGEMRLAGESYSPANKREAEARGVQIVQQELNIIPELTVAENLLLTRLPARAGVLRVAELNRRATELLDRFGLPGVRPDAPAGSLGVGHQQVLEIAAALDRDCRLLILDEPTAALSAAESEQLFAWLDRLRTDGVAVLYISHRLAEVARLSDRVTVLRDGERVGEFDAAGLSTDAMVAHMTGVPPAERRGADHQSRRTDQPALRVDSLSGGRVREASLTLRRGERLGISGLVGSGRTELLRLIFGADRATGGHVLIGDALTPRRFRHPTEAAVAGLAMVTEDRKQDGLLLTLSNRANATLCSLGRRFAWLGLVRGRAERRAFDDLRDSLDLRCQGPEQPVGLLSGGNQQKTAIGKWLLRDAEVFLLDEPTRGIDVGARRRIYELIESLAGRGKGVLIVSSDLDELLETCDRIVVMSDGRVTESFERDAWSREAIMQAAFSEHLKPKT